MKLYLNIVLLFISSLIILQFSAVNIKLLRNPAQDFEVNFLAGKQVLKNQNPYLKLAKDIVRITPPTLVLFELFAIFPILVGQLLWFISSIAAFFLGSYFLFKIFNSQNNWKIWLSYLSLVFIFFPFRYNLGSGQVNNFLFLFLVLAFYYLNLKKYFLSGLFVALGITLKITPALFLLPLVIIKEGKLIKRIIYNLVSIILLTLPFIGFAAYQNYFALPGSFFDFSLSVYTNQSFIGFLARVSDSILLNQIIYAIFLTFSLAVFLQLLKKGANSTKIRLPIWNITILYMLVFAPFAWQYHFVITIFPLATTAFLIHKLKLPVRFFFILAVSYFLIGFNIKNPEAFTNLIFLGPLILSHVLLGTVLLLFLNYYLMGKLRQNV